MRNKGITLIPLIITVIILIILAGISIETLTGKNGLLTKVSKAAEKTKIAEYTERINLIVIEEITERMEKVKEELLIKTLKDKIKEQDWVEEVFMTDENGIEKTDPAEGKHLIVETKDGYELIVEVNNVELWAKVIQGGKASKEKYEVTYIEEGKKEKVEVRPGFSIVLKECNTTKQGYKFIGWCEKENGEGEKYAVGSLYKPTKNTKLYAIFEATTVKISFNANGGQGQIADIEVMPSQETRLPNNSSITKTGYTFKGWNTNQTGTNVVYSNNATITITQNITLYAVWEENITATVSIKDKKITEGTTVSLSATAGSNIQKVELKVGNTILYSENNIGASSYNKNNIGIEQLKNLDKLAFYNDITVTFEVTCISGKIAKGNVNNIKNYTVSAATQLNQFANVVNGGNNLENETIIQLADIDMNPGKWTTNSEGITTFQSGATEWQGIGSATYDYDTNSTSNIRAFKGRFNGNNNEIKGIYINNITKDRVGLFSMNEGIIENIILKNSSIKGRYYSGGVSSDNSGQIRNCKNYANVSGTRAVGGISSSSTGTLYGNINYGHISGISESGWQLKVDFVGGIAGWGDGEITKCGNYGNITSTNLATIIDGGIGGIIGGGYWGNINECYNLGTVNSDNGVVAGIIGAIGNPSGYNMVISKCYNNGGINGSGAAGILSWGNYVQIQDCYNKGNVIAPDTAGGIADCIASKSSIINCYNVGNVNGVTNQKQVGGILGLEVTGVTYTNCYNLDTSSTYAIGTRQGGWAVLGNDWADHIEVKDFIGMKEISSALGENWAADTKNINDGYPILKWQISITEE